MQELCNKIFPKASYKALRKISQKEMKLGTQSKGSSDQDSTSLYMFYKMCIQSFDRIFRSRGSHLNSSSWRVRQDCCSSNASSATCGFQGDGSHTVRFPQCLTQHNILILVQCKDSVFSVGLDPMSLNVATRC